MKFLVRIASENNIKSDKVRKFFMRRLGQNMAAAMRAHDVQADIIHAWGRMFVESDHPEAERIVSRIFGVHSVSPVDGECAPELEAMADYAHEHYKDLVAGKSFAVRVRRSDVGGFKSVEAERSIGARLYPYARCVDLENPEVLVTVEARREGAFFFSKHTPGPCGLPIGVQGKALCLISGGFDSVVAAWYMMKRGIEVDFLFCNLGGAAYERSVLRICKALTSQWAYGYKPACYVADFAPVTEHIKKDSDARYAQILLKRFMYRVGDLVASRGKNQALITGEAIGQVSSQTLPNLCVIDQVIPRAVFRPLIGFDKDEIMRKCRDIGMFDLCNAVREYCSISEEPPITHARLEDVVRVEESLDVTLVERLNIYRHDMTLLDPASLNADHLFTTSIPKDAVVIDCRESHHFDQWHYPESRHMEFADLMRRCRQLPKEATYVMYCPFGLQSAVAAERMQDLGYEAYSFLGGVPALKAVSSPES